MGVGFQFDETVTESAHHQIDNPVRVESEIFRGMSPTEVRRQWTTPDQTALLRSPPGTVTGTPTTSKVV